MNICNFVWLTLFLPAKGRISPYMSIKWPSPIRIGLKRLKCYRFIQADLLQAFCKPYWKTEILAFKKWLSWNILIITSCCEFIKHKWKWIYRTEIAKILGNAIKKRHFLRHLCRETFGIFPQNIAAAGTILWHFLPSQNVMTRRNGSNPEDRNIFENWLDSITSLQ